MLQLMRGRDLKLARQPLECMDVVCKNGAWIIKPSWSKKICLQKICNHQKGKYLTWFLIFEIFVSYNSHAIICIFYDTN